MTAPADATSVSSISTPVRASFCLYGPAAAPCARSSGRSGAEAGECGRPGGTSQVGGNGNVDDARDQEGESTSEALRRRT